MVKVVAIAGTGRSGSTILDNVLGGVPGAFSVGELRYLWQRGLIERRLCGCSRPLPECEVWPGIIDEAFPAGIDPKRVVGMLSVLRTRYTPALLLAPGWYRKRLEALVPVLDRLYREIAEQTGARFIIDSSKLPGYVYTLGQVPSIDLRVVHLLRDPRAVAYSRGRRKEQLDTAVRRPMTRSGPTRSALDWLVWNSTIRRLFSRDEHYMQLRYEDLVTDPGAALQRILALADAPDSTTSHVSGASVELQPNHTVSGNPGRFRTGTSDLRLDEAWRREMDPKRRRLVELITAPARRSFGY